MPVNQAVWEFLYWAQTVKIASKLSLLLDLMRVPNYRKYLGDLHTLQWLDRNMHVENRNYHLYPEARRLLSLLFNDSRYHALKWDWWRSVK